MLKIFLLEDDQAQLQELQRITKRILMKLHQNDSMVLPYTSTTSLTRSLPEPSSQNVFILDLQINHNKKAGLQLSQLIRENDSNAVIIFITVHDELLYTTYKYRVQALDFISKDADNIEAELLKDFRLITQHPQQDSNLFKYKAYNQIHSILLDDICYFTSINANTHSALMYTNDHKALEIHQNLREIAKSDSRFFRVHRSYLVNPHTVKNVDFYNRQIEFYNGMACPISRRKSRPFFELVKKFKHPHDKEISTQE